MKTSELRDNDISVAVSLVPFILGEPTSATLSPRGIEGLNKFVDRFPGEYTQPFQRSWMGYCNAMEMVTLVTFLRPAEDLYRDSVFLGN